MLLNAPEFGLLHPHLQKVLRHYVLRDFREALFKVLEDVVVQLRPCLRHPELTASLRQQPGGQHLLSSHPLNEQTGTKQCTSAIKLFPKPTQPLHAHPYAVWRQQKSVKPMKC